MANRQAYKDTPMPWQIDGVCMRLGTLPEFFHVRRLYKGVETTDDAGVIITKRASDLQEFFEGWTWGDLLNGYYQAHPNGDNYHGFPNKRFNH